MKKDGKSKGVVKGAPSGFVISLFVHAAAIMLAGFLVVFTVTQKEEKKFVPPKPVERPKMKLKKPKVKVKKTSKPKATTRIVTKVKRASMPDIQLPEMSGMGEALGGGLGEGFNVMPDLGEVTLFGGGQTIGNDFVGTFYDFKRDRNGRPNTMTEDKFVLELTKFVTGGWKPSRLAQYYRSPKKLYATAFMIPPIRSQIAPAAFDEPETLGYAWAVHYKGQLVYPEDIKFRFWGMGDDVMVVRVDGEVVLNACWPSGTWESYTIGGNWVSSAKNDFRFYLGNNLSRGGDWIELKAGEPKDMELIIGETPGGQFCSMLTVEVFGEEYPRNRQGGPVLPIFKTEEPSLDLQDAIYRDMIEGEADVTGGPIFRDYVIEHNTNNVLAKAEELPEPQPPEPEPAMRVWTTGVGKQFEAEFIAVMGDKVSLKTARGRQQKVPLKELSSEDLEYIELADPPKFNIDFVRTTSAVMDRYQLSPMELQWNAPSPRVNDYTFGAKVRQTGARPYNHELTVEYFAIAREMIGDKFILADRGSSTFTPSAENKRSHSFLGEKPIEFVEYELDGIMRGKKFYGSLVTLTDKRGVIIAHSASSPWLWEHIENLKKMPVGRYMDKTCTRVHPTSPKPTRY